MPRIIPVDAGKTALSNSELEKLFNVIEELSPLHRLVFYLIYDTIRGPKEIMAMKLTDRNEDVLKYYEKQAIRSV